MKQTRQRFFGRLTALTAAFALSCVGSFPANAAAASDAGSFYDDFSGEKLDRSKWLIAEKNWGGTVIQDGKTVDYNGGVIAENVAVRDDTLVLTGLGNQYTGSLRGINRDGSRRTDGKRCGGAIATKEYYGSGSYEIRAKIAPELGCCSAMWTFEYEENYSGDTLNITNHEIDIEFPGRDKNNDFSLNHALCTTWITEDDYHTESVACGTQADGEFHTYRFDWHTGSNTEIPRVEYYFDNQLTYTAYEFIPTNESRFWLGLWFPKNWAGTPAFDTAEFTVDYVRITPFHESGDTPQHETYSGGGWAKADADLPKGWLLWHSYSTYAALDSKLYLHAPDGTTEEISGDFIHAMNGSFGAAPEEIVFMAIDPTADEWDIFLYRSGTVANLTKNSGFRNEDPKWSPDGKQIVFKRGRWDQSVNDFVYNLALLDLEQMTVTMLTDDAAEEAMPCFSADGNTLYYTSYTNGIGAIMRMDIAARRQETVFSESGVNAYYPVTNGTMLFFTKWLSAENHCDQLMCCDGQTIRALPFDSTQFDCSDACPVGDNTVIYSGTADGGYDLYFFDGQESAELKQSTEKNDLGADFYAWSDYEAYLKSLRVTGDVNADGRLDFADVQILRQWLLAEPDRELIDWEAADLRRDGRLDSNDLCLMKRMLLQQTSNTGTTGGRQ